MKKWLVIAAAGAALVVLNASPGFSVSPGSEKELKQILENQERILGLLEEIKKELYVVKIRASR